MNALTKEIWALRRTADGGLVPPVDEDGTEVFMAWPSREQAERGMKYQIVSGYFGNGDLEVVQVK